MFLHVYRENPEDLLVMRFEDIKNYGVNLTDNTDFKQFGVSDDANKKFLVFEEFKKYLEEQGINYTDKEIMEILNSNTGIETLSTENLADVFNKILNLGNTVKNNAETPAITEPLPEAEQLPAEKTITDEQNGGFDNEDLLEGYDTKVKAQDNENDCYEELFSFASLEGDKDDVIRAIAIYRAKNAYVFADPDNPKPMSEVKAPDWEKNNEDKIKEFITDINNSIKNNPEISLDDYAFEITAATQAQLTVEAFRELNDKNKLIHQSTAIDELLNRKQKLTAFQQNFKSSVDLHLNAVRAKLKSMGQNPNSVSESSMYDACDTYGFNMEEAIKEYLGNPKNYEKLSDYEKSIKALLDKGVIRDVGIGTNIYHRSSLENAYLKTLKDDEKIKYEQKSREEQLNELAEHLDKNIANNDFDFDQFIKECAATGQLDMLNLLYQVASNQDTDNLQNKLANLKSKVAIYFNVHHANIFNDKNTEKLNTGISALKQSGDLNQDDIDTLYQIADNKATENSNQGLIYLKGANKNGASDSVRKKMVAHQQDTIKDENLAKEYAKEIRNGGQELINFSAGNSVNVKNPKLQGIYFNTAVENNAETAKYVTENGILAKLHEENQAKAYETTHNAFESGMSPEEAREWNSKLYNQVSTLSPEAQHTIASNPEYAQEFTNYTANAVARDRELQGLISIQPYAAIPKTDKEIFREHWEAMTPTERYNFICNISLKNFSKLSPALRKRILEHAKNDPVFMKNLVKRYGLDLLKNQLFPDALSIIVRELFNDPSERVKVAREVCNDSNRYPASLVEDCQLILAEHYGIDESSFEQLSGMEKRQALQDPNRTDLTSIGAQSGTNRNNLPDYSNDYFKKKSNLNGLV